MNATRLIRCLRARLADSRGLALLEFALSAPLLITVGVYGIEMSNLALIQLKVNQIALGLADNASRVGVKSALAVQNLREADINDTLTGARMQGENIELTKRGRITISSIQNNPDGGQWIKWQRCLGQKTQANYQSTYGAQDLGKTGTAFAGMGPAGAEATAPPNSAVIFVEINYEYKPIINFLISTEQRIHYVASYVVRDRRDLVGPADGDGVFNPGNDTTPMRCNLYTETVPRRG